MKIKSTEIIAAVTVLFVAAMILGTINFAVYMAYTTPSDRVNTESCTGDLVGTGSRIYRECE
jgi:hypothetical protein